MRRVAWLTCALLAAGLAHARVYERCELARELQARGVPPERLATWVCIAFHESRFDTAANNPYSGDHGIFQISELYWCGPGKACALPCAALRDDHIADDLACALQVHEEHTRLQGDGFLAWVVYPQHCKHNTKKYLVDCDNGVKSSAPIVKSRAFAYEPRYYSNEIVNDSRTNVEDLLPPYLAIGNIFRGSYGKVLDHDEERVDWYNYKINNIDELRLPQSYKMPPQSVTEAATTTTSTTTQATTTTYVPPVVPWRRIETNQFRKKTLFDDKTVMRSTNESEHTSVTANLIQSSRSTVTTKTPSTQSTMQRASTSTTTTVTASTTTAKTISTTTATPITITTTPRSTTTPAPFTFKFTTRFPFFTSKITTSERPTTSVATTRTWPSWFTTPSSATARPAESTSTKPTTKPPDPTVPTTARSTTTSPARRYETTTARKPKSDFSWYTFTSRTATPVHTQYTIQTTSRPTGHSSTTPRQTTPKPRSTQSIFDLYLNPTKPPKLPPFNFDAEPSRFRLKIFASGTTTPAPTRHRTQTLNEASKTNNLIKRHS